MNNRFLALLILGLAFASPSVHAQDPAPAAKPDAAKSAPPARGGITPLRLLVTVSRFQGEKKISSMPYMLSVSIGGPRVNFRIGAQVPYATTTGNDGAKTPEYRYRDVGIGIDVFGQTLVEPGVYKLDLSIDDSSLSSSTQIQGAPSISGVPIFRSFRTGGTVILKDGQTTQLTNAADPISGETMRVDVTLTVPK